MRSTSSLYEVLPWCDHAPTPAAKQGSEASPGYGHIHERRFPPASSEHLCWAEIQTLYDMISHEHLRQGKVPITCRLRHVSISKGCDLYDHKVIRIFEIMTVVHVLIRFGIAQEY